MVEQEVVEQEAYGNRGSPPLFVVLGLHPGTLYLVSPSFYLLYLALGDGDKFKDTKPKNERLTKQLLLGGHSSLTSSGGRNRSDGSFFCV